MSELQQPTTDTSFSEQTAFQIYIEYSQIGIKNVIDFSIKKLHVLAKKQKQTKEGNAIQTLMQQYINNNIAICWKRGQPYYVFI